MDRRDLAAAGCNRALEGSQQPLLARRAGQHVLEDSEGRDQGEVLVDEADLGLRHRRVSGAGVRNTTAVEQAEQRGLARAAGADQTDHLARCDVEVQHARPAEGHSDVRQGEAHRTMSSSWATDAIVS